MPDEQQRRPGRPPIAGERFVRMQINVPRDTHAAHAALAALAARRAITVSALSRQIFAEWMRDNPPTGVVTPVCARPGDRAKIGVFSSTHVIHTTTLRALA